MTGTNLKDARTKASWTQQQAASALDLTQAYLSMVERGHRPMTSSLTQKALKVFALPPTTLPLTKNGFAWTDDEAKAELGRLGYPGFSYLRGQPTSNPAQLLFNVLDQAEVDTRVVEALPWLTCTYVEMDWEWLLSHARQNDRQNRLGLIVTLAGKLATRAGDSVRLEKLNHYQALLERSRLVREDTLCHDSLTQAERRWLRTHRPAEALHWNLLTDLDDKYLANVAA